MSELIIIAGPQAAGKSTVIAKLIEQYQGISPLFNKQQNPIIFPMQESRQIVVHKHMLLGAIFMTKEHEKEVIKCDFQRMNTIEKRNEINTVYLDECNIFTLAHAKAHGINVGKKYWSLYIKHLMQLNAKVIFLNVPVTISWERRKRKYEQRLIYFPKNEHSRIMYEYEQYLINVHVLLEDVYNSLQIPKCMINGEQSYKNVIENVSQAIFDISTNF